MDNEDLRCAKDLIHIINTVEHKPIKLQPIRRSWAGDQEVNREIQKLLDNRLLVNSNLPWASLILIFKKKDGSNQVVID